MDAVKRVCIVGAGGFGRETLLYAADGLCPTKKDINERIVFMVDENYFDRNTIMDVPVIKLSEFDPEQYEVVIAVADPLARKDIARRLPKETKYTSVIHSKAMVTQWASIGVGAIVAPGSIITCNIAIGIHAHINLNTTIGHDCKIGDFFTTAPGVNISGNCTIGDFVYVGTNASIREKILICDNVTIGMGSVILKNIEEPGTYIGNPARKLIRSA